MKSSPLVDMSAGTLIGGSAVLCGVSLGQQHFLAACLFGGLTVILTLLVYLAR